MLKDRIPYKCPLCHRGWKAPIGLIINSAKTHFRMKHKLDEEQAELFLKSLREEVEYKQFSRYWRKYRCC